MAAEAAASPSFDCATARARVDKLICNDPTLARLDQRAAALFQTSLTHTSDAGEFKKAQRRWLRARDDCKDANCVQNRYEQRIDELASFTGRFDSAAATSMCSLFEQPDTRATTLAQTAGTEDINNDGKADIAAPCAGGTMNAPCAAYVAADAKPIHIQPQAFEWHTYSPLGRSPFRYEGRTFVYHSRDAALVEPAFISYVTPTNREFRVCDFETRIGSAVAEGGDEVCAAVESADRIEDIEMTVIDNEQSIALGRPDTFARHRLLADIDNDGLDESLIELSYESGGGQGCTFNYFELLAEDRQALLDNSNSAPVRELQGLGAEGYRGRNCGRIDNRLFKFDNKVFYETNVLNNRVVPHEVRALEGTAVVTLCTFERQMTTKLKTVF